MSDSVEMTFQRFGRSPHLRIETVGDLAAAAELDEAHWVATGAPISTINGDPTFLKLVDADDNGRIICFEVIGAIRWLLGVLRETGGVAEGRTVLRLDAIDTDHAEGRRIHRSASKILSRLGTEDSGEITLDDVRRIRRAVESTPVSEAGVVLPEASGREDIRQFIDEIVATVGGSPHPGGRCGVDRGRLEEFLAQAKAHLDWRQAGEIPRGRASSPVMPLGDRTAGAFALLAELRDKIDQYFAQCQAVAFDPRLAERVKAGQAELDAIDISNPDAIDDFIAGAALAEPRPERVLALEERVNPRYASRLKRLRREVIEQALERPAETISLEDWRRIKDFFAAHQAWSDARAGQAVEPLGADKLRRYLDGQYRRAVESLIAESTETALVLDDIRLTEKVILYQGHLLALANNFVSFPHLYDPTGRAMFEMGTLVMDGRRFNFSVKVADRARHSLIAGMGSMYVLYVEVIPGRGKEKYEIAVPVTYAGKGNLRVGKRGIFEDIAGGESDARVVQIVENPISLSEALVSPFQRLGRLLSGKIEAITASAEKRLDTTAAGTVERIRAGSPAGQTAQPSRGLLVGGLLMGGGVALAALGSAVAYIAKTLKNVENYTTILAVIGVAVLAVVVPTTIVAFAKLRRRDLSAILEGSGWAINARMRLTRRQGRFFTQRPRFPKGARGVRRIGKWLILIALIAAAAAAVALISAWL